ncbi:MAG: ImmA/IrrE family metallo-endopeptidase [Deltaproteobacteria bacterium]|nr:ImmA/IrrE family metallo-endopeptidase [Deltaproteobacteria bacterium]
MDYAEFSCRWINKEKLWKVADDVREKYWPEATLPIDAEKIVEFRLKLIIDPKHNLFSEIDMDAYLMRDLTGIVVDYDFYWNEKFSNRMRFSFAHEMGHFFLHKYILPSIDFNSPEEWRNFILNVPEKEYSGFEWQANEFAGRLLVPYPELVTEFDKILKIIEENKLGQYLENDPDAVLSRISPALCKPFGVSTVVIETRVKREGLWPPK